MINEMEELDIQELGYVLWKSKKIIILAAIIGVVLGILYHYFMVVPLYKASTSLSLYISL